MKWEWGFNVIFRRKLRKKSPLGYWVATAYFALEGVSVAACHAWTTLVRNRTGWPIPWQGA